MFRHPRCKEDGGIVRTLVDASLGVIVPEVGKVPVAGMLRIPTTKIVMVSTARERTEKIEMTGAVEKIVTVRQTGTKERDMTGVVEKIKVKIETIKMTDYVGIKIKEFDFIRISVTSLTDCAIIQFHTHMQEEW